MFGPVGGIFDEGGTREDKGLGGRRESVNTGLESCWRSIIHTGAVRLARSPLKFAMDFKNEDHEPLEFAGTTLSFGVSLISAVGGGEVDCL